MPHTRQPTLLPSQMQLAHQLQASFPTSSAVWVYKHNRKQSGATLQEHQQIMPRVIISAQ
jgi:hypothetical protein